MILTLLALSTLASAEPAGDAACAPPEVRATIPSDGQVDVPIDAILTALVSSACSQSNFSVSLMQNDVELDFMGPVLVSGQALTALALDPSVDLEPNTAYQLVIAAEFGEVVTVGFTTGTGLVGPSPVPDVTIDEGTEEDQDGFFMHYATGSATLPAGTPSGQILLEVRGAPQIGASDFASGDAPYDYSFAWGSNTHHEEICVRGAFLGLGGLSASSEYACIETVVTVLTEPESKGCSSVPGFTGAWFLLGLLPLLRRRA